MKKGFTLIELLAVIIILAIVAVIATPMVLNVVDDAKNSARDSKLKMYADSVKLYATENYFDNNGNLNGGINNSSLNNKGISCVSAYYYDSKVYLGNCTVDNENGYYYIDGVITKDATTYNNIVDNLDNFKDNSGANVPDLFNNMVAVKYDGTNWVIADLKSKWYDYDNKEWANAVVLNTGVSKNVGDIINVETEVKEMYVWIPRYKYTIFNDTADTTGVEVQEIQVKFEKNTERTGTVNCTDSIDTKSTSEDCTDINGTIVKGVSTYTHPAFKLGNTELTGIWVGKFENSNIIACTATDGSIDTECDRTDLGIQIKPNVISWRAARIGSFFTAIKALATQNSMIDADSHMMKNMEWGSVAYFKQSKYGLGTIDIGINNNTSYTTGCGAAAGTVGVITCDAYNTENGVKASTTGNVYGIYDMSGGAWEYTMGNMATSDITPLVGYNTTYTSGFKGYFNNGTAVPDEGSREFPDYKYTNMYSYDSTSNKTHSRGKIGDATKETLITYGNNAGGWNSDYAGFPFSHDTWFSRGGQATNKNDAGIFTIGNLNGNAYTINTSRTVLSSS